MHTSLFDLFKIGIGPSSSHTVGPMKAAYRFAQRVKDPDAQIMVELYGSLALTGKGHATDRAIMLGLAGHQPDTVDPRLPTPINPNHEIIWHTTKTLPGHSNGMRFSSPGVPIAIFYSIGGGFITEENELTTTNQQPRTPVPHPFRSAAELLEQCAKAGLRIDELVLANETAWHTESEVRAHIARVWQTMQDCTRRGLETEGTLPGGLNVRRRAPGLMRKLLESKLADPLRS
ncbi:MAG: serine dehydratase beta chain, partial [Bryobacteraceae bacterium]